MSVLRYVKNENRRFHTFVTNRVSMIRDGSTPVQWHHVEGTVNPGDHASRAMSADALLNCERWLMGPEFLWKPEEDWPQNPLPFGSISCEDPEVKPEVKISMASMSEPVYPLVEHFQRTSSWHRLKKSVAWLLRYRGILRRLTSRRKSGRTTESISIKDFQFITVEEMKTAQMKILKNVQRHHFPEEFKSLEKPENEAYVKKSSSLRSLDPIMVDGLIRVGGRLSLASTSFESQHQIVLPKNDHVTNLIVESYHLISGHSGREYVLSLARMKFWIINASSVIRRVLSKCFSCRRRQAPLCEQKMVDLPKDRWSPQVHRLSQQLV